MKNILKIIGLGLTLFLVAACDQLPENILDQLPEDVLDQLPDDVLDQSPDDVLDQIQDLLPSIELIGKEVILVEQNTEFIDPGVKISEDFDLKVTVVSNIDVTVLGDYTVTYSIEYESITYSGTRTVRVVEEGVIVDFNWIMILFTFTHKSVSTFVAFNDEDGLLQNGKASLYQGDTLVESIDLVSGDNPLTFNNLIQNTKYIVVLEGTYLENGVTVELEGYELSVTTEETVFCTAVIKDKVTTHNSYSANIEVVYETSNIVTKTAYLYLGQNIVKEMELTERNNIFTIEGLLPGTVYVLKLVYTWTPSAGGEPISVTKTLERVYTDKVTYAVPVFVLFLCTVESTNLECAVGVEVTGLIDVSVFVEVWENDLHISSFPVSSLNTYVNITDLDSSTTYTLKLYANYRVIASDIIISNTLLHEETFTTLD